MAKQTFNEPWVLDNNGHIARELSALNLAISSLKKTKFYEAFKSYDDKLILIHALTALSIYNAKGILDTLDKKLQSTRIQLICYKDAFCEIIKIYRIKPEKFGYIDVFCKRRTFFQKQIAAILAFTDISEKNINEAVATTPMAAEEKSALYRGHSQYDLEKFYQELTGVNSELNGKIQIKADLQKLINFFAVSIKYKPKPITVDANHIVQCIAHITALLRAHSENDSQREDIEKYFEKCPTLLTEAEIFINKEIQKRFDKKRA